ncbi:hypothetical protein [uncultured Gimesia sp.]|uniref:hypothetical protein n=1 Tax=uncultured Gimesia sp. TaxID=1678688 RepID=UPI00260E32D3|nr:hypothetical protein [uncultured Gimesia sp.]
MHSSHLTPAKHAVLASDDSGFVPAIKPPAIIRAEANFLRFPFFALHSKGLRQLDGIECIGRKQIHGRNHEFKLSVTRNTKHLFPGTLSRSVHYALLSILQEQGIPYQNPIIWKSWNQLTEQMGVSRSGEIVAKIKDAIRRTSGVLITTNYALTIAIGEDRHVLPQDEHGYHLYDAYRFKNDRLHDGSLSNSNAVWLSNWYLRNLNSLYSGPLHYPTWLALDHQSSIASRLYEFLLFNSRATKTVCINYATLASFLPIKTERYRSAAERQLAVPFRLLHDRNVVADVNWTAGTKGQIQLLIRLGSRLNGSANKTEKRSNEWPEIADAVEIREIRNDESATGMIVRQFHEQWSGNLNYRPTKSELAWAKELVDLYGRQKVEKLLTKVVSRMKQKDGFPTAKNFGATRGFFPQVIKVYEQEMQRRRDDHLQASQEVIENRKDSESRQKRKRHREEVLKIWENLNHNEQKIIEEQAFAQQRGTVLKEHFQKNDEHRKRECLKELDRQRKESH